MRSGPERPAFAAGLAAAVALTSLLALPLFSGRVYTFDDLTRFHLPLRQFYAACLASGRAFDWMPGIFCGFYLQGEGQAGLYHPLHALLYALFPLGPAFMIEVVLPYPVMLLGTYALLRRWGLGRDAALFGGLLFAFSGFNLMHYIHMNALATVAHMPWLLWASDRLLRAPDRPGAIRAGLPVTLLTASQLLLGHPQFTWYSLLAEGGYALLLTLTGTSPRRLVALVAAKALGVLAAAVQILPTLDLIDDSGRNRPVFGYEFWTWEHLLNLAQFVGPYLFRNRALFREVPDVPRHELALYCGAVAPVLVTWLVIRRKEAPGPRPLVVGAGVLAALALVMTFILTTPLGEIYKQLPVVRLFRINARHVLLLQLALAGLSAVALADLGRVAAGRVGGPPRRSLAALAIPPLLAVLAALWAACASMRPQEVARFISPLPLIAVGPLLLTAAALLVLAAARGLRGAVPLLVLLAAADLGAYGLSYVWTSPTADVQSLITSYPRPPDGPGYRVHLTGRPLDRVSNLLVLKGFRLVSGYAAMMPERVLDYDTDPALRIAGAGWKLDYPLEVGGPIAWTPVPSPLPRARLLTRAFVADDPRDRLGEIDPADVALVGELIDLPPGRPGTAELLVDEPGYARIATRSETRQLLVLAESYHDGWQAQVDGQLRPTIRVYGDFLGVIVEPGPHQVTFHFQPLSLRAGRAVSLGTLALLVGWAIVVLRARPHGRARTANADTPR